MFYSYGATSFINAAVDIFEFSALLQVDYYLRAVMILEGRRCLPAIYYHLRAVAARPSLDAASLPRFCRCCRLVRARSYLTILYLWRGVQASMFSPFTKFAIISGYFRLHAYAPPRMP